MDSRFAGVDLEIEPPSNFVIYICSMKLFCLWLNWNQFHPNCAWKQLSKTCMKLPSAECTVENS